MNKNKGGRERGNKKVEAVGVGNEALDGGALYMFS